MSINRASTGDNATHHIKSIPLMTDLLEYVAS
jgi:hypothetical protein